MNAQPIVKLSWIDDPRYEYPLGQAPFVIGRDENCSLPLVGNQKASRRHAEIVWHQGQFWLRDLGSHNGTQLNGQPVRQEMLYDGDAIFLGGLRFRVVNPYLPAPPDRAQAQNQSLQAIPSDDSTGTMMAMAKDQAAPPKSKAVLVASLLGSGLLFLILIYALTSDGGGSQKFPQAEPYGDLHIQTGEVALVTIPFADVKLKNPECFSVGAGDKERSVIKILGKEPGAGEIYALYQDKASWYRVRLWVEPRQAWPPGWNDSDRLKEAEKVINEGDQLFKNRLDFVSMLKAYYLFKKASRLFANSRVASPAENDRINSNMAEFQPELDNKEYELQRELKNAWAAGDFAKAREYCGQLLRIFPADGTEPTVMSSHGDVVKNRQYRMLAEFLERLAATPPQPK